MSLEKDLLHVLFTGQEMIPGRKAAVEQAQDFLANDRLPLPDITVKVHV
jgi:hypothetical protein